MKQTLPRGYLLPGGQRIMKSVSQGEDWEIYSASGSCNVLAVSAALYERWTAGGLVPEGLFLPGQTHPSCRIFCSREGTGIFSMEQGPFPTSAVQILAFSAAMRAAGDRYPKEDFHDAIYLEESALLLPVSGSLPGWDRAMTYGRWISAGVNVSAEAFDRLRGVMGWFPGDVLEECVKTAGFRVNRRDSQAAEMTREETEKRDPPQPPARLPSEPFRLTGRPQLEKFFQENIVEIVLHRQEHERMGIPFPGATVLYGPPGCGKTYAVDRLCEYLGWKRFDIDSATVGSSYIHDTSKKIAAVFQDAIRSAPSILVIDEMESFLSDRQMSGSAGLHHMEEMAEFLRRIPEAVSGGVLVFAMTNLLDRIDPAILRRGRFDYMVEVTMPSAEEVRALLAKRLSELPAREDIDLDMAANRLAGHPMSDVAFVLREAGRFAVRQGKDRIDTACLESALELLPKKKEANRIGFL